MRRRTLFSRLTTLIVATLACLLLALFAPFFISNRASDEPFTGAAVMASPRDMQVLTGPIRLSTAPDLMLSRGALYADGNAALGMPISRFVLDGPVFTLNASGLRETLSGFEHGGGVEVDAIAPLVEQLMAMGFDALTIRRGTLNIVATDGSSETIADIEADVSGRRKGQITARGEFGLRGQRVAFEATVSQPAEKKTPQRWPAKLVLKGGLLQANFDGFVDVTDDLQLSGQTEVTMPSVRRVARWFSIPVPNAEGLNAAFLKGQFTWARRTLAIEQAKITIDNNEATGSLALNLSGDRPMIDGTLAFGALDLTPYIEAARSQSFVFDRETASWSTFDLSFPIIKYVDTDLRISTPKIAFNGFGLGRAAATITVRSGKLLADIAEVDLNSGLASAQLTADTNELVPRYALRGKVENFEAATAATALLGTPAIAGRSSLVFELAGAGQTPMEVLRHLSGKATMTTTEGGRLALDPKVLRTLPKEAGAPGWGVLGKGSSTLEQFEARAIINNGVVFTESAHGRSGGFGLAASGRVNLLDRSLDLRLVAKPGVPTDRPLKQADMLGGDAVRVRGPWEAPTVRGQPPEPDATPKPN